MATFRTYAEVLMPDHPLMKLSMSDHPLMKLYWKTSRPPGAVLADVLSRTGGAYETTTPLSAQFRDDIRAVAELTADDELRRIAELPEVPVSLENCRLLDPQTRIALFCCLDVSPAETPRWRRVPPAGRPTTPITPRSELARFLRGVRGARVEEHALRDGRYWRQVGPAADLPA
jgi:hypothetical protein